MEKHSKSSLFEEAESRKCFTLLLVNLFFYAVVVFSAEQVFNRPIVSALMKGALPLVNQNRGRHL